MESTYIYIYNRLYCRGVEYRKGPSKGTPKKDCCVNGTASKLFALLTRALLVGLIPWFAYDALYYPRRLLHFVGKAVGEETAADYLVRRTPTSPCRMQHATHSEHGTESMKYTVFHRPHPSPCTHDPAPRTTALIVKDHPSPCQQQPFHLKRLYPTRILVLRTDAVLCWMPRHRTGHRPREHALQIRQVTYILPLLWYCCCGKSGNVIWDQFQVCRLRACHV